jgi:hypothetical protein
MINKYLQIYILAQVSYKLFKQFIIPKILVQLWAQIKYCTINYSPTDAIPTLSWWWGLSAPETLGAMTAVA